MENEKVQENQEKESIELEVVKETPEITKPAEADVKDDLSSEEIRMAKEHKLVTEGGEKDGEKEKSEEGEKDKQEEEKVEEKPEGKKKKGWIDLTDEEKAERNKLSKSDQGLYIKQKRETRKRQQADAQRDQALIKLKYANEQIETLKELRADKADKKEDGVDEILGDDKPKENLKEVLEKHDKDKQDKDDEANKHANAVRQAVYEQGEEAKLEYSDFDKVTDLADKVIKNHKELFADKPKLMAKAGRLYKEFVVAASNALDPNQEETAADIAYELGQLHPDYKNGGDTEKKEKKEDTETKGESEKLDRMVENANKKVSSASVAGGGGSRKIAHSDLTLADVANMSTAKFNTLPREVRERILKE